MLALLIAHSCSTSLTSSGQPQPSFPRLIWHNWTHPKSTLRESDIISYNLLSSPALTLPINFFIHPHTVVHSWRARMSWGVLIGHSFLAGLADHLAGQHGFPDGTLRGHLEVTSDFRVSDQINGVFLAGVRGASLCDGRYNLPVTALDN